jgi:hypothetical protein
VFYVDFVLLILFRDLVEVTRLPARTHHPMTNPRLGSNRLESIMATTHGLGLVRGALRSDTPLFDYWFTSTPRSLSGHLRCAEWTLLDPLSLSIDLDCTSRTVHAREPPLDCSHHMYRLLYHESPALDMYHGSTRYCLFPDKLVSVLKSYKRLSCPQRHTAYPSPTKRQLNPPCACLGPSACTCHSPRSTWVRRSLPSIASTFLR